MYFETSLYEKEHSKPYNHGNNRENREDALPRFQNSGD
jgi:hypothetical protein